MIIRQKTFKPKSDTANPFNAVPSPQAPYYGANNVIKTGAQTSAGDNPRMNVARVKKYLFPRARFFDKLVALKGPCLFAYFGFQPKADKIVIRNIIGNTVANYI